mmetsp:Transcript_84554/g.225967  ORF Transcript_84554/g.225967 Transcript_84554/m.225967 type:complete len:226 (-) Transcript_84554:897-1574(-)
MPHPNSITLRPWNRSLCRWTYSATSRAAGHSLMPSGASLHEWFLAAACKTKCSGASGTIRLKVHLHRACRVIAMVSVLVFLQRGEELDDGLDAPLGLVQVMVIFPRSRQMTWCSRDCSESSWNWASQTTPSTTLRGTRKSRPPIQTLSPRTTTLCLSSVCQSPFSCSMVQLCSVSGAQDCSATKTRLAQASKVGANRRATEGPTGTVPGTVPLSSEDLGHVAETH